MQDLTLFTGRFIENRTNKLKNPAERKKMQMFYKISLQSLSAFKASIFPAGNSANYFLILLFLLKSVFVKYCSTNPHECCKQRQQENNFSCARKAPPISPSICKVPSLDHNLGCCYSHSQEVLSKT